MEKKYKESMYNIVLSEDANENIILYNSYSGSVCEFDKVSYAALQNTDETNVYFNAMIKQGFIVPEELDELGRMLHHNKSYIYNETPERMQFVIAPTLRCPLDCYYCFEQRHSGPLMSEETADKIVDYITVKMKNNPNLKSLLIVWFGGEPLIGKDIIIRIGTKLYEYCINNNVVYVAKMLTNGVLLTPQLLNELVDNHIITDIQFTLDGNEEQFRQVKKGTSQQFYNLLDIIKLSGTLINTHVRLNVTKENTSELLSLVEDVLNKSEDNNRLSFYAMPVVDYKVSSKENEINDMELNLFRNDVENIVKTLNKGNYRSTSSPRTLSAFCGAMRLCNITFGPEGEIYRCENLIGDKNNVIGTIYDGLYYNKEHFCMPNSDLPTKCNQCSYLPICWGGCPAHRIKYNKEFDCEMFKMRTVRRLLKELNNEFHQSDECNI